LSSNGKPWFEVEGVRYYIEDEDEEKDIEMIMNVE
jgi:hypothetical protein